MPQPQIVFEIVDGRAMPRLPRVPDDRHLSIEQAARATGRTVASLHAIYRATFAELLTAPTAVPAAAAASPGRAVADRSPAADGPPASPVSQASPMPVATDPPTASPADDTGDDPPDASLELDPAAVRVQRDRLAHALHFADLTEVQFDLVRTFAFERQFDLLSRHLWATTRHDAAIGGPKLFIGLTIEGFRAVAHRTGQYAGCDRNEYQYAGTAGQAGETGNAAGPDRDAWDDDDATKNVPAHPVRAIATVYRRIDGHREQFVGEAVWRDLYTAPAGGDVLSYRDQAPETWLGKCAKAAALREAFPNELGGIYTPEEMARTLLQMSRPGRRGGGVEDAGRTTQPPSHANTSLPATACDESVCSQRSFELALIDEGAKGEADRRRILKLARQRLPDLARLRDPAAFYGHAIADVRNNPQAYSLPAAVMA